MKHYYLKLILALFGIGFALVPATAQQEAQYTNYMFNTLGYNPAYAGTRDAVSALLMYRNQWTNNIDGAPEDFVFNIHTPLGNKVGVGLAGEYDRIGVHDITTAMAMYTYRFYVGNNAKLSVGLQGGVKHLRSNYSEVNNGDIADPVFAIDQSRILPNFGVGLHFYTNLFYVSFSIPHMLENDWSEVSSLAKQDRHYYLAGGLVLPVAEGLKIKPQVLLKTVPSEAPITADVNLNLLIRETLWIGGTYRFNDAFALLGVLQATNNLRIGYSYDFTTSALNNFTNGSHEVFLGLDFATNKNRIVTPRYF